MEQVWNHSKVKWEFVRSVPAVLQVCSESRAEFLRSEVSPVYQYIMATRPFYFSTELDTIYVRHRCLLAPLPEGATAYHDTVHEIKLNLLSEHLHFLQMDWGLEPYWWPGSHQEGPTLLRSFPNLEVFTLIIIVSKWALNNGKKKTLMEMVKKHTVEEFQTEQSLYPEWRMPIVKFHCGEDGID